MKEIDILARAHGAADMERPRQGLHPARLAQAARRARRLPGRDRARASAASPRAATPRSTGRSCRGFPRLEIVANFGVGYDLVDAAWAGQHGVIVTNTPDVLTEEVADTALGLLLMTMRELPQAERWLRAGHWPRRAPIRSPTTRCATRPSASWPRPHRQGDRQAARGVRRDGRLSRPHQQKDLPYRYYAEARRDGAATSTSCSASRRAGRTPTTSSTPRC